MDERKGIIKPIIKYFFISLFWGIFGLCVYGGFVFWQTQTIQDPTKCLVTTMYQVNLCPTNKNYVGFKSIPKVFFQALILSEDAAFYSHQGFDWAEIKESFRRNFVEWRFARGGSTLTQQLAKNLYLSKDKSLSRKFKEFFIAQQIEKKLSKTLILEKYANVVEFGDKIYGLKPAARHYFGKTPDMLNVLESVYLVSLLPNPARLGKSFQNRKLSKANIWRMKIILERMYRTGKITDEVFVYLKMLMEDFAWPFDHFSEGMFEPMTIEDQLFQEFEGLDETQLPAFDSDPSEINERDPEFQDEALPPQSGEENSSETQEKSESDVEEIDNNDPATLEKDQDVPEELEKDI